MILKKIRSKKAMVLYYPIIIGLVIALSTFYFLHTYKNSPKETEFVGQIVLDSYKEIQDYFKHINYIEQSAKYSIHNEVYTMAKRGFYFKDPICLYDSSRYIMWENIIQDKDKQDNIHCYPLEKEIKKNFELFLNKRLNRYFDKYTLASIPQDNYDFSFEEEKEITKIKAIATQDIIISSKWTTYSFKPSFEIDLKYNLITKFTEYSAKAQEIRDNIQHCLIKGSTNPDDEDFSTCSNINKLQKDIEDISHYQLTPIVFPENYTLLFDIEDDSFKSPYSNEKLEIKFGIRFMDKFSPPSTEMITKGTAEVREEGSYITWKKNNASDVVSYSIYVRALEPSQIDKNNLIKNNIKGTEWKIEYAEPDSNGLKEGETYYFYIVAHDNAGNNATTIEPVKITI